MTTIELRLTVTGPIPPDVLQGLFGVEATKSWAQGDPIGKSSLTRIDDGWQVSTEETSSLDLEAVVQTLFERIPLTKRLLDTLAESRDGSAGAERAGILASLGAQTGGAPIASETLASSIEGAEVELACIVTIVDERLPSLHLNAAQTLVLAALGAELDIDLYLESSDTNDTGSAS